jgi:hypothetical protein
MMSYAAHGVLCPIAPVGSHSLPTVPVSGQPHGVALLSRTVAT